MPASNLPSRAIMPLPDPEIELAHSLETEPLDPMLTKRCLRSQKD
jgi:hypothetical protein